MVYTGSGISIVGETLPGETSHAVVDLLPGSHAVLDDALVRLFEMGFEFPDTLEPGPQEAEVTNTGDLSTGLLY